MRGMVLWISGAALAFFATAGAFLLLANLATVPSEKSLTPDSASGRPGSALELSLNKDQLASLEASTDQSLDLMVKNESDKELSDVNLTLGVSSEDTAIPVSRYYRTKVEKLPAGESRTVRFVFDLSAPEQTAALPPAAVVQEPPRKLIEIKATTPEGVSAVRTAILPP